MRLTLTAGDINLRLQACFGAIQFYILTGDFAKARIVTEELALRSKSDGVSAMMKAMCNGMEPYIDVFTMEHGSSLRTGAECLAETDKIGIHIWDHMLYAQGVFSALNQGDIKGGGEMLRKMKAALEGPKCFGLFHYHLLSGWYHLRRNETTAAAAHAEEALNFIKMSGAGLSEAEFSVHYAIAQIAHEEKDYRRADKHLAAAIGMAGKTESSILQFMNLTAEAQFALDRGEDDKGLEYLREAMELGRSRGYISMFWWWRPDVMSRLCGRALEEGIEEEYVRHMIVKRRLYLYPPAVSSGKWPYPVKIHTLGNFRVILNGKPLEFSGKVQQKPLALLKAIISLGGRDVPQERLIDALWPDAEGDNANKALEVNIYRLRNMMGIEGSIKVKAGQLSIDPDFCWTDVHALDQVYENSVMKIMNNGTGKASSMSAADARLAERVIDLYSGPFLQEDDDKDWTLQMRERVRKRVLTIISALAGSFESAGEYEQAAPLWSRGIEIDNLSEEFYQRLMACHAFLGRKAEVVRTYRKCCDALSAGLDIEPSEQTTALFKRLTGKTS